MCHKIGIFRHLQTGLWIWRYNSITSSKLLFLFFHHENLRHSYIEEPAYPEPFSYTVIYFPVLVHLNFSLQQSIPKIIQCNSDHQHYTSVAKEATKYILKNEEMNQTK